MDEYRVYLMPKAYRDIDGIYAYIAENIGSPDVAETLVNEIEGAILGLSLLPHRGAKRKMGTYSDGRYRQIFVKNYSIIYRIVEKNKEVVVVTVRYMAMK